MTGYKDMTFCKFYKECKEKKCHRALTKEVIEAAHKWWGNEHAPICMFIDKPDCFEEEK